MTSTKTHLPSAPGPRGHLLVGHIPEFRNDILDTVYQAWRQYGDVVKFQLANLPIHVVSHPDHAQSVLVQEKQTFVKLYDPDHPVGLQLVLGQGLVTNSDTESWLMQRRMMQPMFHRKHIATMGAKMNTAGERLLERWSSEFTPQSVVNMSEEMMRVTLDIINQTMFSADVLDSAGVIGPAVSVAAEVSFKRAQNPLSLPLQLPTPQNRRFKEALKSVDNVLNAIISERRTSGERRGDLLDMLLDAQDADTGERMNDRQIRDEVATIFGAGHETTANALTWSWYLLSQHPEVQQQMQAEIDSVLQGRTPTMEDLPNLPLVRYVFDEAMRLFPPAPLVPRQVAHDTELGGYALPKGSRIFVSIYNIHRHPEFWERPEQFDPWRFDPANAEKRHRLAFMPFGAGPRMCIGNNFALTEGPLLLAIIAQKYSVTLAQGHTVKPEVAITMRPHGGMPMQLHPRA